MSRVRVVVTGVGAVCAAGLDVEAIWRAVVGGRTAIGTIRQWDAAGWPTRVAGEVTGVDARVLVEDRRLHKLIRRTDLFGLYAAERALTASGVLAFRAALAGGAVDQFNDRTGVFAGSGAGAYQNQYEFFPLLTDARGDLQVFGEELSAVVNPMWLLRNLPNNVVCHIGIRHGLKGANACVANHCVGGVLAVTEASAALRAGEADRAVAVGHDAPIEPETFVHFHGLDLLAREALRPFDAQRDGTLLGEGAAAVVLETWEAATLRGGRPWGEILGSGCTTEGEGLVDVRPDGDGVARAITLALEDAGVGPASVGMIVAHGNGTRQSDASEAAAIRRVFGPTPPPVTAFKWAFGHAIAASGVLDLVLALAAVRSNRVPGIATLRDPDPTIPTLPVSPDAQVPASDVALVISRGFAGMCAVILVRGLA